MSSDDMRQRLGRHLQDRYEIVAEVGAGGMATVYLAEDLRHHRKVALKVLRPELSAVMGSERFLAEIRTTASLQHPNILPLFDSGEAGGLLFYVMPYVEGESLRQKLDREGELPIDEAIQIASEVAEALQAAHEQGVIHRDVKPANILLSRGRPLVADFGIALAVNAAGGGRLTETGLSLGSPNYMSPEQASPERVPSRGSDIYSLGCVLYEMLVGEPPFTGTTARAVLGKVLTEEPMPPARYRRSVPPNVNAAVLRALEKRPADRFKEARAFAQALADPDFAHASPHSGDQDLSKKLRRHRMLMGILATLVVVSIGMAAWGWLNRFDSPVVRANLEWPAEPTPAPASSQAALRFALSPDGTVIAFAGGGEATPLAIRRLDRLELRTIPGTEGARYPFFSPDGQFVAFFLKSGDLKVVPLEGGSSRTLVREGARIESRGDWGPDGMLYYGGTDGSIWRVPFLGGAADRVSRLDSVRGDQAHQFVDVLSDGKGAIVSVWRGAVASSAVGLLDFGTGEIQLLETASHAWFAPPRHLLFVTWDGAVRIAPLDLKKGSLEGPPALLLEGVWMNAFTGEGYLAFSESGTLLYRTGVAHGQQPVWVDLGGATTAVDAAWYDTFYSLALSPDGKRLAVTLTRPDRQELWVKQLDEGPLTLLSSEGTINYRAKWTADGQSLTFISDRSGRPALWMIRADGSAPAELLVDDPRTIDQGFLSRDGEWIVFRTGSAGFRTRDLYAVRNGTTEDRRTLVASDADEYSPALSPDGRWLAYVSEESGQQEVYVRPFPATGAAKWQISVGGGTGPLWAHGGGKLFYQTAVGGLMVADIEAEQGFIPGTPRMLFRDPSLRVYHWHPMFDLDPDDRRLLMIREAGAELGQLILVLNWFEEIEEAQGG